MRLASLLRKTTLENLRDWKVLVMTVTFAPFFAVLMYLYFESASSVGYDIAIVNEDEGFQRGNGTALRAGNELIEAFSNTSDNADAPVLRVREYATVEDAGQDLESGVVDLVLVIPRYFSRTIDRHNDGITESTDTVVSIGDPSEPSYPIVAAWADAVVYTYVADAADLDSPVVVDLQTVNGGNGPSEFDLYVPGLLAMAMIMLMFTAAASLIKEKDKGTLVRIRLSNISVFEWMASVSVVQVGLGILAVWLTFVTAIGLGFRGSISILPLTVLTVLSSLSIVAISVLVAAWLRTVFDLMTIGCFPFFILLFFSGAMFPLPDVGLVELAGRSINVNDLLPATHSISAFDSLVNHGAGLVDISYELAAIAALTVLFFAVGSYSFKKRHMSTSFS